MNRGVGESPDAIWRELRAQSGIIRPTPSSGPSQNHPIRTAVIVFEIVCGLWASFHHRKRTQPAADPDRAARPPFELRLWLSASSAQARARSKRNLKQYRGPMATPEPKPALVCSPAMTTVRPQRNGPSLVSLTASNRPLLLHLPGATFLIGTVYFRESGDPSALGPVVVTGDCHLVRQ
jgi:hypothetical protein